MQLILASAKIMRSADSGRVPTMTTPIFDDAARRLALELSQWSVTDLAKALHCSAAIAMENHQRFQQFMLDENRIPAILAYYAQSESGVADNHRGARLASPLCTKHTQC